MSQDDDPMESGQVQMSLAGLAAPLATDRLFFATFPDPAAAARISGIAQELRRRHALRGRLLRSDRLHITLNHVGDHASLPPAVVSAATRAGSMLKTCAFEVTLDSASSFSARRRNRPFVLRASDGVAALLELQRELVGHMTAAGLARHAEHRFTPHVTLLYDDVTVEREPIAPISWIVRDVVLVHSLLGRSEHRVLERWTLPD